MALFMKKVDKDQRKTMMLNDKIPGLIWRMALPPMISFLITSIYNLADTYFVSSLGTNATAAVSVNASIDHLIMMAGSMLAMGSSSYISRLLGQKNEKKASNVLSTGFFTALFFGAIVMLVGLTNTKPLVRLLGATDTCEEYSIQYATYVLIVAPIMAANFVMNHCLRAEGSATLSMIGMGIGGIINCILDPIFIFNLNLGVAGASIATAISKVISFAILIFPYLTRRSMLHLSLKNFLPSKDIVTEVISVGSASLFRTGLGVVAAIVLNNLAGSISDAALAGVGVAERIMRFPFGIFLGFGSGLQPVVGFNWGAKRYDRVREGYRFSTVTAFIGGAAIGILIAFFAEPLIGLFSKTDPDMLAIGTLCLRAQCLAMVFHAWVVVINMLCTGLGNAKGAMLLATARQGTCFLPIIWPMTYFFGATGLAITQGVADVLTLLLAVPILRSVLKKVSAAEAADFAEAAEG